METPSAVEPIKRLIQDLSEAAATLSADEARFLVDNYYTMQKQRIRAGNQIRALTESGEPHAILQWYATQSGYLEGQVLKALEAYAKAFDLGQWALSICGIGPVIAAGLLAHIDIRKAPTVGHIWRFAGYDPTTTWNKKEKRPWNAQLKTLCWKIGESFVKVSSRENDVYGKVWLARKEVEIARNEAGELATQAAAKLEAMRIGKDTEAYKHYSRGKLPPAHIHSRAKRYAVKLFLSHYHEVGYQIVFGEKPPAPYIFTKGGHAHKIAPPNWPIEEKRKEAA